MTTDEANVNSEVDHAKRVAKKDLVELLESPYIVHNLFEIDLDLRRNKTSNTSALFVLLYSIKYLRDDLLAWAKQTHDQ
jgi:hypothetical protein